MTTNWRKIESEADLPEPMTAVLAYAPGSQPTTFFMAVAYIDRSNRFPVWVINKRGEGYGADDFTHWMPLPEPPEGDE